MSARLSVLSNGGGFGDASARGRGSSGDLLKPGSDGRLRWVRQGRLRFPMIRCRPLARTVDSSSPTRELRVVELRVVEHQVDVDR